MITPEQQQFVNICISTIVSHLREEDPTLAPGEIYDAMAQELERRCRDQIEKGATK